MPIYALGELRPQIHPQAYVHPDAVVIGAVTIGAEASVWPAAVLRGDFGRIEVGARTSIQDGTVVHTTAQWPTLIGADCVVGHNAHLEGCVVEDHCLIGSGSIVLNRARVSTGSVIGANALVPEDLHVPPGHLALGTPARPKPMRQDEHRQFIDMGVDEYRAAAARYRTELVRLDAADHPDR